MKILPFLIFFLTILLFIPLSSLKAQSSSVQVSAIIDEHISYSIVDNKLLVSTNNPNGFLVLSNRNISREQNFGPSEQVFNLKTTDFIIIIVNF